MKASILLAFAAAITLAAVPAYAGRTAIDGFFDEEGNFIPLQASFGGYCDLNGDDCASPVALNFKGTAYTAQFADGSTFDSFYVHGNGLLTFGSSIDFGFSDDPSSFYSQIVNDGSNPLVTSYGKTLVSVGQNNQPDPQSFTDPLPFFQSAAYGIDANGLIFAEFFTCVTPGIACRQNVQRLTLRPTATGFAATITGVQLGNDRGYVVGGKYAAEGNTFFIPATLSGIPTGVPEPASWALMIGGFGMIGAAVRGRQRRGAAHA